MGHKPETSLDSVLEVMARAHFTPFNVRSGDGYEKHFRSYDQCLQEHPDHILSLETQMRDILAALADHWDVSANALAKAPNLERLESAEAALRLAYTAMNHLGDVLNGIDAVEGRDIEITAPGFEAARAHFAKYGQPK